MSRSIRIFASLQEQEDYNRRLMTESTVETRFRRLKLMQEFSRLLHPGKAKIRKIQIRKWTS